MAWLHTLNVVERKFCVGSSPTSATKLTTMETNEFIEFLEKELWSRKWRNNKVENDVDWEYERSYADFIYDELTIWKDEKRVSVSYNDIGWGYTNYESYNFTYDEFKNWWEGINS